MQIDEFARRYRFRPLFYLPFFPFFFFFVCVFSFLVFAFSTSLGEVTSFLLETNLGETIEYKAAAFHFPLRHDSSFLVPGSFFLLLLYTFSPISIGEILKGWIFIIAPPLTPSPHRFSISIVEIDSLSRDFDIKFSFFSEFCTWPKSFLFVIPEAKRNNKVTDYNLLKFLIGCTKNINFNFNQLSLVTVVNINYIY